LLQQFAGQLGQFGKFGAFQAQLGTFAPGTDALAIVAVHRVAVAAAQADLHALALPGAGDGLVEDLGDAGGQLGRIVVLGFAVEGDLHQVVGHLLAHFGAQADLVVVQGVGLGRAGQQGDGQQQGGETDGRDHANSLAIGPQAVVIRVDVALAANGLTDR